jgi:hypothetical protein
MPIVTCGGMRYEDSFALVFAHADWVKRVQAAGDVEAKRGAMARLSEDRCHVCTSVYRDSRSRMCVLTYKLTFRPS